ncbi:MAG TPA: RnfABCDGE type electron transport complex subunit G [Aromatoleum sp.]|uniref:RnfABCDGE type electron transport complex subunit G n=1 Tax=Aromatoleum sp. TaxID=2307007 RepID=UPI002B469B99|nr:RnfABCDGE type electron transport complex subunit G [Aromatoleum sp.]HJV27495.1 RnfABCDGE type electron transport complex subunit G [Aromatoleum sp.]
MSERYSAGRTSARTAGILVLFTIAFTAPMAATYNATRPAIEASAQEGKMRLINEVLPPAAYDNALLDDYVTLGPTPQLGLDQGGRVYRARRGGAPAGLVLETIATDGYAGRIQLVVAVAADGTLSGVRVVTHKETPGLGDYIDPRKDRNKDKPWIGQFAGMSLDTGPEKWKVGKDGGAFAYRVGATISARAVTNATRRALEFAGAHRDALFAAHPGAAL